MGVSVTLNLVCITESLVFLVAVYALLSTSVLDFFLHYVREAASGVLSGRHSGEIAPGLLPGSERGLVCLPLPNVYASPSRAC